MKDYILFPRTTIIVFSSPPIVSLSPPIISLSPPIVSLSPPVVGVSRLPVGVWPSPFPCPFVWRRNRRNRRTKRQVRPAVEGLIFRPVIKWPQSSAQGVKASWTIRRPRLIPLSAISAFQKRVVGTFFIVFSANFLHNACVVF